MTSADDSSANRRDGAHNQTSVRRRRYAAGISAERLAAVWLTLKGYWILGSRVRTPSGEIDIIAVRGKRLAFVEVKRRASLELAEASVTTKQRQRIRRAASLWIAKHPRYQSYEQGFDLIFLLPRRLPRHLPNAL